MINPWCPDVGTLTVSSSTSPRMLCWAVGKQKGLCSKPYLQDKESNYAGVFRLISFALVTFWQADPPCRWIQSVTVIYITNICRICKGPDWRPGIFIQYTKPNSLARRCGLQPGDQILQCNRISFLQIDFTYVSTKRGDNISFVIFFKLKFCSG